MPQIIPRSRRTVLLLVAVLFGVLVGVGAFTFQYAKGLSYFSKDPAACANCHIMQTRFDSWQKASHHVSATCVDCHLPHSGLSKWIAKADNGYRHSKGFTFEDFPEPIVITEGNERLLQDNCLRCHGELVHDLVTGSTDDRTTLRCVRCHSGVGHGETVALGGPETAEEANWKGPSDE